MESWRKVELLLPIIPEDRVPQVAAWRSKSPDAEQTDQQANHCAGDDEDRPRRH